MEERTERSAYQGSLSRTPRQNGQEEKSADFNEATERVPQIDVVYKVLILILMAFLEQEHKNHDG